jgi:2-polyprenyl-3-methyl-5-hydroxy-6-metoxy-1,4-benzoquinol methylase
MYSIQHNHTDIFIDSMPKDFFKDKSIIDFGSGDGYAARRLKELGANEILTVDLLQSQYSDHHATNIFTVEGKYDIIWSHHCLEHIPNYFNALNKLRGLLNDTGHLILAVPNMDGVSEFSRGHINNFTMPSMITILQMTKFNVCAGKFWTEKGQLRVIVQPGASELPDKMHKLLEAGRVPHSLYEGNNRVWI